MKSLSLWKAQAIPKSMSIKSLVKRSQKWGFLFLGVIMNKEKEARQKELTRYDNESRKYIIFMCRTCKFYDNKCLKNRVIRDCAKKGLKNQE